MIACDWTIQMHWTHSATIHLTKKKQMFLLYTKKPLFTQPTYTVSKKKKKKSKIFEGEKNTKWEEIKMISLVYL
jgi:hypothetical protein